MDNLNLLVKQQSNRALHIADNDMIHIMWKHVTLRINVTGLICLVEFLNGNQRHRSVGFEVFGNLDDGFQIWIADVGLRLTVAECYDFKRLLNDGLAMLRDMGKHGTAYTLPNSLKLTLPHSESTFSAN